MRLLFTILFATIIVKASEPWEQIIGTWREIPVPSSASRFRIEANSPNLTISECKADGTCGGHPVTFQYDGKRHPGPADWGMDFSFRKLGASTVEEKDWVANKEQLKETDLYTISSDGRTMTQKIVHERSRENRRPSPLMRHYTRQENGPRSSEDSFVGSWVEDVAKRTLYESTYVRKADRSAEHTSIHGFTFTEVYDGQDHPVDSDDCDAYNSRFTSDRVFVRDCKKDGKLVRSIIHTFSEGGDSFKVSVKNASGEVFPDVAAMQKIK